MDKQTKNIDSRDVELNPDRYAKAVGVRRQLKSIAKGEPFSSKINAKGDLLKVFREREPSKKEKEEARTALDALIRTRIGKKAEKRELKRKRNDEEAEELEKISLTISRSDFERGQAYSEFGARRFSRFRRKVEQTTSYKDGEKELNDLSSGAYDPSTPLLSGLNPLQQMVIVSNTTTERQDLPISGLGGVTKVRLEGYGGNGRRSNPRPQVTPRLSTIQIELPQRANKYRKIAESSTPPTSGYGHDLLGWLEVLRNTHATLTQCLKEELYQQGHIDYKERFSAESSGSFMEPQNANSDSRPWFLRRVQENSALVWLKTALITAPDQELGKVLIGRERTTPRKLKESLELAYGATGADRLQLKKAALKEVNRFIRAVSLVDIDSSDSDLSDEEFGPSYKG